MTGRRKRPHVPDTSRKRVARACDTCRRLKEKCEGGFPCSRCMRLHHHCEFLDAHKGARSDSRGEENNDYGFFDRERINALEGIVRHYSRHQDLGKANILQIARSLPSQPRDGETEQIDELRSEPDGSDKDKEDFTIDPISSIMAGERSL
jgi:hypothetical protein